MLFFAKTILQFHFMQLFPYSFLARLCSEVHLRWLWHVEGRGKEEREIIFVQGWMDGWTLGRTNGTRQQTGIRQLLTPLQCVSTRQIYVSMVKDACLFRNDWWIPYQKTSVPFFFLLAPWLCRRPPSHASLLLSSPTQLRVRERNV